MNIHKLNEERKIVLLNSALMEFVSKGYDEASTNTIAKNAGISKSLMFHYVTNKNSFFC
ncbi:helix-turn-helix transcriptional regulator [Listeria welshimeri]|nr:helix-turn-helix transcriptional regulator [Listeria welshimeri]